MAPPEKGAGPGLAPGPLESLGVTRLHFVAFHAVIDDVRVADYRYEERCEDAHLIGEVRLDHRYDRPAHDGNT